MRLPYPWRADEAQQGSGPGCVRRRGELVLTHDQVVTQQVGNLIGDEQLVHQS